ncbi:B-family DNA-polymerase [Bacillus phage vB_BpuM-BpSp]|nr:B-family DNA-polymerase [Bacillus phage vB_BpuM-BpSp]
MKKTNNNEFNVTSYSVYLDAMNLYANLRKGQGKEESYSLDYIGEKEVGMRKDDIDGDFHDFHIRDYKKFMFYNIQDTIMMMLMEEKNKDVDMIYQISMLTGTRIEKAMKKTICLRNIYSMHLDQRGFVISNNRAAIEEKPEGKVRGGFVADPGLVDYVGNEVLEDKLSKNIFDNCVDFDLAALYPSIMRAFNIGSETLIGKITLYDRDENDEKIDKGPEIADDLIANDPVAFSHKWFNLPNLDEVIDAIEEKGSVVFK